MTKPNADKAQRELFELFPPDIVSCRAQIRLRKQLIPEKPWSELIN
jgi:hypothetical protein